MNLAATCLRWSRLSLLCLPCVAALGLGACADSRGDGNGACNPLVDASCDSGGIHVTRPNPGSTLGDLTMDPSGGGMPSGNGTQSGPVEDICEVQEVPAQIIPSNVMLVLDKSGSMGDKKWLDHNTLRTRWESLYKTVDFMVGQFQNSVRFGMKLFPAVDATDTEKACEVPPGVDVPIADNNGEAIKAAMPGPSIKVKGGTPAGLGYQRAIDYLKTLEEAGDKRQRIVILVMDGRVTDCSDSHEQMVAIAREAHLGGIQTFVVGIDVSTMDAEGIALDHELTALAQAGGSGDYFDSSNPQRLKAAMEEIVGRISDCRVPIPRAPDHPSWATVTVANLNYYWLGHQVQNCDMANLPAGQGGFVYTQVNGQDAVELCGQACDDYVNTGLLKVNLLCEPPA